MKASADTERTMFLEAVFGQPLPTRVYAHVWQPTHGTVWVRTAEEAEQAATRNSRHDVYLGTGLLGRKGAENERIKLSNAAGMLALLIDADVADPVHKRTQKLPTDKDTARDFLLGLEPPPSIVVDSGHGIQAWWLLKEPWVFASAEDRLYAMRLSYGWQAHIRAKAAERGWDFDNVGDLARVLRIPGTINAKNSKAKLDVKLLHTDEHRYTPADFAPFSDSRYTPPGEGESVTDIKRFRRGNPCPICHGYEELEQGRGERCWGYLSRDGEVAFCTREEHAGKLDPKETAIGWVYPHRLTGECRCGVSHAKPVVVDSVRASNVREKALHWVWPGYIPAAKASVFDGEPDKGKTTLVLDVIARLTRAQRLPDGSESEVEGPQTWIVLSCEDDPADTLVPRLRIAGADLDRVIFVRSVTVEDGTGQRRPFTIPQDVPRLRQLILQEHVSGILIDPLVGFLDEKVDSHKDASVRRALFTLHELAQETGVAILCIRHFKKSADDLNLMNRGGGSIGIVGAMRHGLAVVSDPEQPDVRYFGVYKHNLSPDGVPVLSYSLIGIDTEVDGEARSISRVCWLGSAAQSLDELNREQAERPSVRAERNNREAMKLCFETLQTVLGDGEWHRSTEVWAQVERAGHSKRTYERCSEEWGDSGRLERRKKGTTKDADGTVTPGAWEMRLVLDTMGEGASNV